MRPGISLGLPSRIFWRKSLPIRRLSGAVCQLRQVSLPVWGSCSHWRLCRQPRTEFWAFPAGAGKCTAQTSGPGWGWGSLPLSPWGQSGRRTNDLPDQRLKGCNHGSRRKRGMEKASRSGWPGASAVAGSGGGWHGWVQRGKLRGAEIRNRRAAGNDEGRKNRG